MTNLAQLARDTMRSMRKQAAFRAPRIGTMIPKSRLGRVGLGTAAGIGAVGAGHLGADAYRTESRGAPGAQQYWDQTRGQQEAYKYRDWLPATPTPTGHAPQAQNSFLNFLRRPYAEGKAILGGQPDGHYRPEPTRGSLPGQGSPQRIVGPDGRVTMVDVPQHPTTTTNHSWASLAGQGRLSHDTARRERYMQRAEQGAETRRQQLQGGRDQLADVYRQLGLEPTTLPETPGQARFGVPATPATPSRGIDDYSLEELQQIVQQRQQDPYSGQNNPLSNESVQQVQQSQQSDPVTQWIQQQLQSDNPVQSTIATPSYDQLDMQRRQRQMEDVARTWNAF